MRTTTRRLVVGLGGTGVALVAMASPAFAGTFSQPEDNSGPTPPPVFVYPVNSTGNPTPVTVTGTGFPQGTVYVEICDGLSPTAQNYNVNADCDAASANASKLVSGPSATATFPGNDPNYAATPFRGVSPQDQFNCIAPEDVQPGTKPAPNGSVTPIGATAANGAPIDTSQMSWDNCQLRLASSEVMVTSDQTYLPFVLPNTPTGPAPSTPEVPLTVVLPIGAAGLFGAGFFINRRRRSTRSAA